MTNGHGAVPSLQPDVPLLDVRHNCGRLLFRGALVPGTVIQIRCPKCGMMAVFDMRPRVVLAMPMLLDRT